MFGDKGYMSRGWFKLPVNESGGFHSHGGTPKTLDGLCHGKSQTKMDDENNQMRVTPWLSTPPQKDPAQSWGLKVMVAMILVEHVIACGPAEFVLVWQVWCWDGKQTGDKFGWDFGTRVFGNSHQRISGQWWFFHWIEWYLRRVQFKHLDLHPSLWLSVDFSSGKWGVWGYLVIAQLWRAWWTLHLELHQTTGICGP